MSATFPPAILPGFIPISPHLSLLSRQPTPANSASSPSSSSSPSPTLLILCSWLSAADRHISVYTSEYSRLYPECSILLIRSWRKDVAWRTEDDVWRQLNPALQIVIAEAERTGSRTVLTAFSNGGAYMATQLAALYRSRTGKPLSVRSTILDSCPGSPGGSTAVRFVKNGLPSLFRTGLIGYIASFLIASLAIAFRLTQKLFSIPNAIRSLRVRLNTPTLIPTSSRRLYIFSKMDELVDYREVVKHAKEAEELGWDVQVKEFEGTKHVAHAMGNNRERYWAAVRGCIEATDVDY